MHVYLRVGLAKGASYEQAVVMKQSLAIAVDMPETDGRQVALEGSEASAEAGEASFGAVAL